VPEVLLSGHQANIDTWRAEQSIKKTQEKRKDLLKIGSTDFLMETTTI
jgi:tRNA (guanine37-N1)-methyltransferase